VEAGGSSTRIWYLDQPCGWMPREDAFLTVGTGEQHGRTAIARKGEGDMSILEILAAVAIVAYVIGRQLLGEQLRGKRLILLPLVVVVIGATQLVGHGHHLGTSDIALIILGAVVAAGIGAAQGSMMRLEARDGTLWGQMPGRSLWLWLALVLSRVALIAVASGLGAHVAASAAPIILTLGINRLAQAAVIAPRALAAGIPFAPEKNGSTFLAGVFGSSNPAPPPNLASTRAYSAGERTAGYDWQSGVRLMADRFADRSQQ
jgi:hypothetical protein